MLLRAGIAILAGLAAMSVGGCPAEDYPNGAPVTVADTDRIINDADLTAQEKRQQLGELGLSANVINVLLIDVRTGNQFGGDLRTAYDKVVGGRLREMTPDEVQIYADEASAVDGPLNLTLTDAQAAAMVSFLNEYHIGTREALEVLLETEGITVPSTIPDGALQDVFVDFDPQRLLPRLP